jgi:hypothetical protein
MKFERWVEENDPPQRMLWKGAADMQFTDIREWAEILKVDPRVVSTHTSKSITLPVVAFFCPHGVLVLRDNFYDVCLSLMWIYAPVLAYPDFGRVGFAEGMSFLPPCAREPWEPGMRVGMLTLTSQGVRSVLSQLVYW